MIKIVKVSTILLIALSLGLGSCEKSKDVDAVAEKEPIKIPGMAQGTLPKNGEPCADVEAISEEPLKVLVSFQWTSAEFADEYELKVFESQNEIVSETYASLNATVELDRGKSYSWTITAKNDNGETINSTSSFTTPGEPIGNFVPYAAIITVEFNTATSEMDVSWIGSDQDGDTLTYDVLVKENGELLAEFTSLTVVSLNPISFIPNSSYDIEVICKDDSGNFSISKQNETAPN